MPFFFFFALSTKIPISSVLRIQTIFSIHTLSDLNRQSFLCQTRRELPPCHVEEGGVRISLQHRKRFRISIWHVAVLQTFWNHQHILGEQTNVGGKVWAEVNQEINYIKHRWWNEKYLCGTFTSTPYIVINFIAGRYETCCLSDGKVWFTLRNCKLSLCSHCLGYTFVLFILFLFSKLPSTLLFILPLVLVCWLNSLEMLSSFVLRGRALSKQLKYWQKIHKEATSGRLSRGKLYRHRRICWKTIN